MYLRRLYLNNFRCYSDKSFDFCPGINSICGANAQGKTTVLEAIHYLISGSSFRASQASELIAIGASEFYIEADFVVHGVLQKLRISHNGKERKIWHNQTPCNSVSSLLGVLKGGIITPDHATLVKGAPIKRREFLDFHIAQVDPLYVHHLTRYHRAMRQRNALLKLKSRTTFESWEHEMASSAAYLTSHRRQASAELQEEGRKMLFELSGLPEELSMAYKTPAPVQGNIESLRLYFEEQYQRLRHREMMLGCTLIGPHKDDLIILIGQKEARFFASEGQQRTCVAALHMAEWQRLNKLSDETPLMLIDDFGISLDASRRNRLLAYVCGLGQVFLTSTYELPLPQISKDLKVIVI